MHSRLLANSAEAPIRHSDHVQVASRLSVGAHPLGLLDGPEIGFGAGSVGATGEVGVHPPGNTATVYAPAEEVELG